MTTITVNPSINPVTGKLQGSYDPNKTTFSHGDTFMLAGSGTPNTNYSAFLKPIIDSTTIGQLPSNQQNYIFNESLNTNPFLAYSDSSRGKVLRSSEDPQLGTNYDDVLKHHLPANVPENTWVYWSFYARVKIMMGGSPYPYYFQRKIGRMNFADTIVDGQHPEVKYHINSYTGVSNVDETRLFNAGDSGFYIYGPSTTLLTSDDTWHMFELIVFTGTQGASDGRIIVRAKKNGVSTVLRDAKNTMVYSDSQRLSWLMHQEYFGNWGVTANEGTKPTTLELFNDSSTVIIGNRRIDMCDTLSTASCNYRENQKWTNWGSSISLKLSTAGMPSGTNTLKIREISGYDSNGWDVVAASTDITVVV